MGSTALRRALSAALLAALACAPATRARAAEPALPLLSKRLDRAWAGVTTFQSNLKWPNPASRHVEDQGCGLFMYQKPDRWLLEFHTPRPEKYLVKGDSSWVYVGRLHQVVRSRLKPEEQAQVGLLILGQPTSVLAKIYRLTAGASAEDRRDMQVSGGPALTLEPRAGSGSGVRRAVLFFDPVTYLPLKARIQLESGEDMRMTLERARKNARLNASVWNFRIPEGTAVLDR